MTMKILITGNAGFIGRHLTPLLLNAGHAVIGLDKNPNNPQAQKTTCITGNILDKDVVLKVMEGCDLVVHLAAEHQDWGISKETYFQVNQIGTRNLLDAAAKVGCKKFVFYQSSIREDAIKGSHPPACHGAGAGALQTGTAYGYVRLYPILADRKPCSSRQSDAD